MENRITTCGSGYGYEDLVYVDGRFELREFSISSVDCADDTCTGVKVISRSEAMEWIYANKKEPYLSDALEEMAKIGEEPEPKKTAELKIIVAPEEREVRINIASDGEGYGYQDLDYVNGHFELCDYEIPSVDCADETCVAKRTISTHAAIEWVKLHEKEPYRSQALDKISSLVEGTELDNANPAPAEETPPITKVPEKDTPETTTPHAFCYNCGRRLESHYNFCPACGTKVGTDREIPAPPPEPCRVWFQCPKCGTRFERWGTDVKNIKFGSCVHCGYSEDGEGSAQSPRGKGLKGLLERYFK